MATAKAAPTSKSAAASEFAAVLDRTSSASPTLAAESTPIHSRVKHEARKAPPLEQFEAFVLRSFVEEMLPATESGYFGKGTAGEVWRSMLAEHIGDELAKGGGIGIAAEIAGREKGASTPSAQKIEELSRKRGADLSAADLSPVPLKK